MITAVGKNISVKDSSENSSFDFVMVASSTWNVSGV